MPAVINSVASLALGVAMVQVSRGAPALRERFLSWPLLVLLAFQALLVTPVATFLFRFYPQWSMLYWFDPQLFPELDGWTGPLSLLAVLVNWGAAVGGYALARYGLLSGQRWPVWGPLGVAGVAVLYLAVSYGARLVYVGDYDAFWQGQAVSIFRRAVGWIGLLLYGAGGFVLLFVRRRFANRDPRVI